MFTYIVMGAKLSIQYIDIFLNNFNHFVLGGQV